MTTSPEALREAQPVKCLGERFQDAFLRGWGDDRLVAYADLPAEAQAKWNRAALAFVCTLSDAPSELKSALQEAREALGPFSAAWAKFDTNAPYSTSPRIFPALDDFRRAAEVYRALSPGGAEQ